MSKKFYIEDKNGEYLSEDGKRRFIMLEGRGLYDYLRTPEGKSKKFYIIADTADNCIGIELPAERLREHLKEKRHSQYLRDTEGEKRYQTVSLDRIREDDGELSGLCAVADECADIAGLIKKMQIETLGAALGALAEDEYMLIFDLYLCSSPITVRMAGEKYGIHYATVSKRKKAILKKLKKFFE